MMNIRSHTNSIKLRSRYLRKTRDNSKMKLLKVELVFIFQATLVVSHKASPLIEKTVYIANSSYALDQTTSVVWSVNSFEEATSFLSRFPGTVAVTSMQNGNHEEIQKLNTRVGYKQTVFFASGADGFANFLAVLKPDTVVPIRLILVLTDRATDADISYATKTALENDLADIVIVSTKDTESVQLSTYFPYSKGICGNYAPVNIQPKGRNWFPKKFSDFQKCPIRVTLLPLLPYARLVIENNTLKYIYGIDGRVFTMLMKELNASVDIVSWKDHGGIGSVINGTATGSFGDIVYKRADMFAPQILINYKRYPKAQISHVYATVGVYWFGPRRREIHECLRVFHLFINEISFSVVVSFILFVVVTKLVIRFGLHRVYIRYGVMFQSFIIFLGQEVQLESRSWLVNCLFVMWIWFCMIVRIVYQGDLVDELQKAILENPFKNLEEALRKVDGYGGSEGFREFYRGTNYFDDYTILRIRDVVSQIKNISDGKRFLLASDKLLILEYSNGLQMIQEPISYAPLSFFMRPGWPAAKEIADFIEQLVEAGFVRNILNNHIHKWLKKDKARLETHPLTMQTLIGCFYGLGILYTISGLVFIVEIIYYKITIKNLHRHTVIRAI